MGVPCREKPVPLSAVARDAAGMLGYGHENADALWKQFLIDGSVLVWDGTTNGKGSENYVDDARKLGPEHPKFIDDFISETHAAGGTVSVPTCADELAKKFARLYVSEGCVRYAMVNYCDAGGQKDGPSTTTSFTSRSVGFTG